MIEKFEEAKILIRKNYANIAKSSGQQSCCSSSCSCSDSKQAAQLLGYTEAEITQVPSGANMGLGCGNPTSFALIKEGDTVLDLGSGGGFDCFIASQYVGATGHVIGVDMTPEMIDKARSNARNGNYTQVDFRLGEIEHLPVADSSVDVIISNCVINLSVDKQQVFHEAYRVLKKGGRLAVSDIVATAVLPDSVKGDLANLSGCYAGASHLDELNEMLKNAGFTNLSLTPKDNSREILVSWQSGKNIEDYVASYIIEAQKK